MAGIIIVGNGFDLAHGLPTSYRHFFDYIIATNHENEEHTDLFTPGDHPGYRLPELFLENLPGHDFKNRFFELMCHDYVDKNWCDIEQLYYNKLLDVGSRHVINPTFDSIQELNNDFEVIKRKLGNYLRNLNYIRPSHDYFSKILRSGFGFGGTLILNFNYTDTVWKSITDADYKNARVIQCQIHGELMSPSNDIVFGYAAPEEEIAPYRKKNNQYMRNIKRTLYNLAESYSIFQEFLKNVKDLKDDLDVTIIGHSCGKSDTLILKEIFNHELLNKINIVYHNRDGYFNQYVNIEDLIDDPGDYNKVVTLPQSIRMPQFDETEEWEAEWEEFIRS